MRALLLFFVFFSVSVAIKSKNLTKTKKYRCIELADDEEIQIVKKKIAKGVKTYSREKNTVEEADHQYPSRANSAESIEMPQAHKFRGARPRTITTTSAPNTVATLGPTPPDYPKDVKRDSQGRPLVLSPEHCQQVKKYAKMYGVTDVRTWVRSNCRMAQMFVPGATCDDINTLVESCYKNKFL